MALYASLMITRMSEKSALSHCHIVIPLRSRDCAITGVTPRNNVHAITAEVPLATMFGYVSNLRSMTQGRATYTMQFSHYAEVPPEISSGIVYH